MGEWCSGRTSSTMRQRQALVELRLQTFCKEQLHTCCKKGKVRGPDAEGDYHHQVSGKQQQQRAKTLYLTKRIDFQPTFTWLDCPYMMDAG